MKRAEFALMSKSVVHYNAVPGTNTCPRSLVESATRFTIHPLDTRTTHCDDYGGHLMQQMITALPCLCR